VRARGDRPDPHVHPLQGPALARGARGGGGRRARARGESSRQGAPADAG
jgi:hypothetical protein